MNNQTPKLVNNQTPEQLVNNQTTNSKQSFAQAFNASRTLKQPSTVPYGERCQLSSESPKMQPEPKAKDEQPSKTNKMRSSEEANAEWKEEVYGRFYSKRMDLSEAELEEELGWLASNPKTPTKPPITSLNFNKMSRSISEK